MLEKVSTHDYRSQILSPNTAITAGTIAAGILGSLAPINNTMHGNIDSAHSTWRRCTLRRGKRRRKARQAHSSSRLFLDPTQSSLRPEPCGAGHHHDASKSPAWRAVGNQSTRASAIDRFYLITWCGSCEKGAITMVHRIPSLLVASIDPSYGCPL